MITRLLSRWFSDSDEEDLTDFVRETREQRQPEPIRQVPIPEPQPSEDLAAPVEEPAPLLRNKFVREDTGTHETLKILDESMLDSGEEEGFDPYNTGDFDRSRNWERRFKT